MPLRSARFKSIALLVWILAIAAIVVWSRNLPHEPGWDLRVYEAAMSSLRAAHDPYADGIAIQRVFHAHLAEHPAAPPPFTYVYSPLTLLPLRLFALVSPPILRVIYWALYVAAALTMLWVGLQFAGTEEQPGFTLLAPLAIFIPGLLVTDVIYSGNVAYLLYGLVLATALLGWRRNQWMWFYAAVLLTSCLKAPLLILLAIPVFSARRQWIPAAVTGLAGVALFAMQPVLWPSLFRNYLTAVELQFSFNHDFSASPAGLLADALYDRIPYSVTSLVFYLFYAIPIVLILLYLSHRFFSGQFSLNRWVPVVLIGVTLLNPRIMEYDVAPMTIPIALVFWRFLCRGQTAARGAVVVLLTLIPWNFCANGDWRPNDCLMLVTTFALGVWDLWTLPPTLAAPSPYASAVDSKLCLT